MAPLEIVWVKNGLDSVVAGFTGTNADGLTYVRYENLTIADFVRFGRVDDRVNRWIKQIIG